MGQKFTFREQKIYFIKLTALNWIEVYYQWMMIKKKRSVFLTILVVVFGAGCKESTKEIVESEGILQIQKNASLKLDEKALIKIYPFKDSLNIIKAYIECESTSIDTLNLSVLGCHKELFIQNDTIIIQLTPSELGEKKFQKITILLKDIGHRYKVFDTTFIYNVEN